MSEPVILQSLWHGEVVVRRDTGRAILAEVAERHGLRVSEIRSRTRARRIAWPRQEAMFAIRQRTTLSLPQIAQVVGVEDHTTVLHGIRAYEARMTGGGAR